MTTLGSVYYDPEHDAIILVSVVQWDDMTVSQPVIEVNKYFQTPVDLDDIDMLHRCEWIGDL